jgi:hypothetical protein
MRIIRGIVAATLATLGALALWAAPVHADIAPPKPFYADSTSPLDRCPHGITKGTLLWLTPGPLAAVGVRVSGELIDQPVPNSPSLTCVTLPDDYASTAIFTAYSGSVVVASQSVTADNGVVQFQFTLGGAITNPPTILTKLTVQVCRNPVHTSPPSYCGTAVTYTG